MIAGILILTLFSAVGAHHFEGPAIDPGSRKSVVLYVASYQASYRIAEGAQCDNLHRSMDQAIYTAAVAYHLLGHTLTVTSCRDAAPGRVFNSLHPLGRAIDLRTHDLESSYRIRVVAAFLRVALPPTYNVVIEKDHLHIEFDVKDKLAPERRG